MKRASVLACIACASAIAAAYAASTRSVGQTIVYDVTIATKMGAMPASVPAFAQAQYQAQQAMAAKGSTSTFTFVVDRVDGDGKSHLSATIAGPAFPAAALAAVPYLNKFEATLGTDGTIVPTYDPNMPMETTRVNKYHEQVPTEQSAQNLNAKKFNAAEFNVFAAGCSKPPALSTGKT